MQHRKVYIDDWCLMEKICLVSAVLRLGDCNWSSVCDLLKPKLQENRPWDWFTPEACEAQYKVLFNEYVKTQVNDQSPALQIIQNLKTKCKVECQRKEEQQNKYLALKKKIENFLKNGVESELIDKYYEDVQRENKEKEENLRRHQEALKRREALKIEFEKANVPRTPNKQETKTDGGSSPILTSPLLSSLLNNPPAVQYRPTLSTTSFIPTKSAQSVSKSSTFEKLQSFSSDISFKDSFSSELTDQTSLLDRQPVPVASLSSSAIRKLESQELIDAVPVAICSRSPVSNSCASKIETPTIETTLKSDSQNLESLGLISPNEEEYLTEVDIPPEALLEVIGDLKEGTISLDKLIRDLEATDEGVIIDKDLTTVSIPVDESYTVESKPAEQASFTPELSQAQATDEIKTELMAESKIEVNEVEVHASDLSSSTEADKLEIEEHVVIVEDTSREEHEIHTTETDDIANIEINSVDEPVNKDESPLSVSFSSTVAISVEFDSSFSEQKSDNDTVESQNTKSMLNKSSESEIDEDVKSKCLSKSVVVIKRIEDGANSNKNKKNRNKIPLEESIKEIEDIPCEVDQTQDEEIRPEQRVESTERHIVTVESQIVQEHIVETSVLGENLAFEKDFDSEKGEKLNDETVTAEPAQPCSAADDSDVSDKFEDALQIQTEETNETCSTENIVNVETEMKTPPYADVDESFELNVSEEKATENAVVEDKQQDVVKQEETTVVEQTSVEIVNTIEHVESKDLKPVEDIPDVECIENEDVTPNNGTTTETVQEIVEESKKSEDIKSLPTKIIKSSRRKRKSTFETIDEPAEMSIIIAPFTVKDIETIDYDVEQFAPAHCIKTEPSDAKPEDTRKEQKEATSTVEKPSIKETTPARIKSERRDTKTPEPVVMVLRRSNNKTQSPMKKMDRESRSLDNSEYMKTRKKSILLAHQRLMSHKYANAFQKPITNRQVQGYENVIYKPMDLQTIKRKIENRQINSVAEFQRDILLMLNNAKMFNRINSQVYNMAVEVEEDALRDIQLTVQTLGEGIPTEKQKNIEKIRKRQSLENSKTDLKLIKRIKYSTKDNIFTSLPVKRPKLEENEDE